MKKLLIQLCWVLLIIYPVHKCVDMILISNTDLFSGIIGVILIICIAYASVVTNLGYYFFNRN